MPNRDKNLLYFDLPAVYHRNSYLVFSPYSGEIVRLTTQEMGDFKIKDELKKRRFFGQPYTKRDNSKNIRLVLILTSNCRLRCKYCFVRGGERKSDMNLNTALSAIKAAWKEKKNTVESMEILFFGGEPTLKFELIKKIVGYVKKLPIKKYYFFISTDGLMATEQLNWFLKENFFFSISCDGDFGVQNYLRPTADGNYLTSTTEETIRKLVEQKALFEVRATITKHNLLSKSVEYLGGLGVKFLHFERVAMAGRAEETLLPLVKNYINDFSLALKVAEKKKIYLYTSPIMNLFSPSDYFCTQLAGGKDIISPNGKINLCYLGEIGNTFKLGTLDVNSNKFIIDEDKREFLKKISIPQECHNCAFKYFCCGGCPAENLMSTHSFQKVDRQQCTINKAILNQTIIFLYHKGRRKSNFLPIIGKEILERTIETMNSKNKKITKLPLKRSKIKKEPRNRSRACL